MTSNDFVFAWLEVLDELTYYELLGVAPGAPADDVHTGFHVFCDTFHPDRHITRSDDERSAVATIFKRATEAYAVLSDQALRAHYDAQLATQSSLRPVRLSLSPHSRPPPGRAGGEPPSLDDAVRSPSARPFARRAEELLRKGDLRQAKLQLVMANHMDPGNATLEAALRDLEASLGASRSKPPPAK
jgi:curved DNA-binding protein CbpA